MMETLFQEQNRRTQGVTYNVCQLKNLLNQIQYFNANQQNYLAKIRKEESESLIIKTKRSASLHEFKKCENMNTILEEQYGSKIFYHQKINELIEDIYLIKKRTNQIKADLKKVDHKLQNFSMQDLEIVFFKQRAERQFSYYEKKIEDVMFKKRFIMEQKRKEYQEINNLINQQKEEAEEHIIKKDSIQQESFKQMKQIEYLNANKEKALNKLNQIQNLTSIRQTVSILTRLFLKNEIGLFLNPIILDQETFKQTLKTKDITHIIQTINVPSNLFNEISQEIQIDSCDDTIYQIQQLIEKYNFLSIRSKRLFEHAYSLLDTYQELQNYKIEQFQDFDIIQTSVDELENDLKLAQIELVSYKQRKEKLLLLFFRIYINQSQFAKRIYNFFLQIKKYHESSFSIRIIKDIEELLGLPNELPQTSSTQEDYQLGDIVKQKLDQFKEYLEDNQHPNYTNIGQELFPQLSKNQQSISISYFLRILQNEQGQRIKQMQIKMQDSYQKSFTYKSMQLCKGLKNEKVKENISKTLQKPIVQVFMKSEEVIPFCESLIQQNKLENIADDILDKVKQNFQEFQKQFFKIVNEIVNKSGEQKNLVVEQSWKKEKELMEDFQKRVKPKSSEQRFRKKRSLQSLTTTRKESRVMDEEANTPEKKPFKMTGSLEKYIFESDKTINRVHISKQIIVIKIDQRIPNKNSQMMKSQIYG